MGPSDGPITFPGALAKGTGYRVTVLSQPASPTQTCVVSGSGGTVTADVTTVAVACFMSGAASPLLVSSPVPGLSPTAVYVSLPPGAIPSGSTTTISDLRTGGSVNAAVVDGGFDPVALPAIEGDTLVVVVPATGGAGPTSFLSVVAAAVAPTVVRTDPPPRQQYVSPNSAVVVVSSEPLDPATVDAGSVELRGGPTPVTGTVRFADLAHLQAEFHPDALLEPQTDYQLVLSQGIRDVRGVALDSAVTVPFTTGNIPPAANLVFASVSVGNVRTCGLTTAGDAYCWGEGPALVAGGLSFVAVSAGWAHTCGLTAAGAAYCWGYNGDGELGDGTTVDRATPRLVAGGLSFAAVSAGGLYTCGLTGAGVAYCWGINEEGQLGDGTTVDRASPRLVAGGLTFAAVSAGVQHTCGVTAARATYCWGANGGQNSGMIGDGTTTERRTPTPVTGGVSFAAVSAGFYHTCGLTAMGVAYCWGWNRFGNLGDGPAPDSLVSSAPVKVAGQPE
jgi:Big-like domain-containing protein/regulator of chromosome condensation (RCC1) repeat-containing protein/Regulator of Chromosome Condensation (RCC1) repeat protein